MHRAKKIIFVAHCVLNQNAVVCPLARAKGGYNTIIQAILGQEIGIVQLPCPELLHLGLGRKPRSKSAYDTKAFRSRCSIIAKEAVAQIVEYKHHGYEVYGIIGINESPTCSLKGEKGILMEHIEKEMGIRNLVLPMLDVPTDYVEGESVDVFLDEVKSFLDIK